MVRSQPKYIYLPMLPAGKTAVTIYPFIFWSKKKKGWIKQDVVTHEMYHWNEQNNWKITKRLGLFQWFSKYIFFWFLLNLIKGLKSEEHPMEKPAYQAQRKYFEK